MNVEKALKREREIKRGYKIANLASRMTEKGGLVYNYANIIDLLRFAMQI